MTERRKPPKKQQGHRRSREEAEELFLANMKLVPFVANRMAIEVTEDAIQEGYIGLWKAALLFDGTRGAKFQTFATPVIRHSIIMAWRASSHSVPVDISLEQPYLRNEAGEDVLYESVLRDPMAERTTEDILLDMYLTSRLTETERKIAIMRMDGKPKTGIGKSFGHTDAWVNDRIKSIQRKLKKDFNVKG